MADRDQKLREWGDDELRQAAESVRALLESPGWAVLKRLLAMEREIAVDAMLNSVSRHERMTEYAGKVRGLEVVEKKAEQVIQVAQEREQEIAQRVEAHRG